jgi:hypothetical protein
MEYLLRNSRYDMIRSYYGGKFGKLMSVGRYQESQSIYYNIRINYNLDVIFPAGDLDLCDSRYVLNM